MQRLAAPAATGHGATSHRTTTTRRNGDVSAPAPVRRQALPAGYDRRYRGVRSARHRADRRDHAAGGRLDDRVRQTPGPHRTAGAGGGAIAALGGFGNSSTTADDAAGLERLAEAGEPGAQLAVALIHDYGFRGTAGDTEQARHWYQRAANGGSASAQYYLGKWYLTHAPEADRPESVHWLKRAAEQGQAEAQYLLGELHRTGNGVAKDVTQAADWYHQAADQGNGQAMCRLARLYAGVETGYTLDPPVAAMHDQVARTLGEDCGLPVSDYGASDKLADWAKQEGTRLAQTRLAKGFTRRPGP